MLDTGGKEQLHGFFGSHELCQVRLLLGLETHSNSPWATTGWGHEGRPPLPVAGEQAAAVMGCTVL